MYYIVYLIYIPKHENNGYRLDEFEDIFGSIFRKIKNNRGENSMKGKLFGDFLA